MDSLELLQRVAELIKEAEKARKTIQRSVEGIGGVGPGCGGSPPTGEAAENQAAKVKLLLAGA